MSVLTLCSSSRFLPYNPLFLYVKVILYPCSLNIDIFLQVSAPPHTLRVHPLLSCSFNSGDCLAPSSLRRSHCSGTPSLSHLRPPALSPLFSSAPPPQTLSTPSALSMSLQSAAKSYKQALNYNKTMGALLSNGSDSRVTYCVLVRVRMSSCAY